MSRLLIDSDDGYGTEGFGEGYYGSGRANVGIAQSYPYSFVYIDETGDPLREFAVAEATPLNRIDRLINAIYRSRFLEYARGRELEKLAAPVGVTRRTGELDETLRYRTRVRKAVVSADDSFDDFIDVLEVAFGDDVDRVRLAATADSPGVVVTVPSDVLDGIPLSEDELRSILEDAVPPNDVLNFASSDSLILGGEDFTVSSESTIGKGELAGDQD